MRDGRQRTNERCRLRGTARLDGHHMSIEAGGEVHAQVRGLLASVVRARARVRIRLEQVDRERVLRRERSRMVEQSLEREQALGPKPTIAMRMRQAETRAEGSCQRTGAGGSAAISAASRSGAQPSSRSTQPSS